MDTATHAQALRDLADWIEENGDVLGESDFRNNASSKLLLCRIDKEEFVTSAQALGLEHSEIESKNGYLNVTRTFGPVAVQVYIAVEKVGVSKTAMRPTTEWTLDADVREALALKAAV